MNRTNKDILPRGWLIKAYGGAHPLRKDSQEIFDQTTNTEMIDVSLIIFISNPIRQTTRSLF
jgi:hypothetical protein